MSQQKFVDRKEELGFLEERYKTDLADLSFCTAEEEWERQNYC